MEICVDNRIGSGDDGIEAGYAVLTPMTQASMGISIMRRMTRSSRER